MSDFMILGLIFQVLGWTVYKVRAGAAAGVSDEQKRIAAISLSSLSTHARTARATLAFIGEFDPKFGCG